MKIKRKRAVAIVIYNNKILLVHRSNKGREFWVFPGGGVEEGEELEDAVLRELKEETSIDANIVKFLYKHSYTDIKHEQYFFLCEYLSGEPRLGDHIEKKKMQEGEQTYDPRWVEIANLPQILVYPLEIRDWLIKDLENDFQNAPREEKLDTGALRQ